MNRSLSMTSSAPGMPRGVGCAPVAITTCPGRNVSSPTRTVSGSTKVAVPWRAVTPDEVNHCSMRVDAGSVNVRLKAISAGQSTATCPVMPPDAWPRARSTASAALKLHRLGGIEQHLLRLAAAQRAGSTELAPIDRGHTLAGGRERRGRGLPRNAGPDDDDVETLHGRLLVW